ncbi:hypothetical protein EFL45_07900 [Weissella confusa]|uniref:hypothetical protein n=1 Tax=Weissella confusa TaxID=1583 RepID=UPI0018F268ED|nr:hypothetical protein [Weissella confusa]MBJ7674298.1 hypothetical protein [Weissella confusa]MCT0949330.1 hypothetical protein [Weissella confusa]
MYRVRLTDEFKRDMKKLPCLIKGKGLVLREVKLYVRVDSHRSIRMVGIRTHETLAAGLSV